ncbi:NAD(P)-dependent oxidoreductase [Dyadobacter alkalitolerans]|uniref:NAD(P)-dependent oxidoreductase n=1 Tax=Dyadobacter alkalitolerans TaxID=492736 RepID=UPI0003FF6AB0|nr:NAD(P)H-binding protein [Dyadobacter alkalitolerans]
MKQITIIGASTDLGITTVQHALKKGHQVVALSSNMDKIADHKKLLKLKGSVTSVDDVKKAITGSNAVIVTVGAKFQLMLGQMDGYANIYSNTAIAILSALKDLKMEVPLLVVSAFGAGESRKYLPFTWQFALPRILTKSYNDKTQMEKILSKGYRFSEIIRPAIMTNRRPKGNFKAHLRLEQGMKLEKISREDVAHFLIAQAQNPTHMHHYVSLTSAS